jgi:hypothetical protein
MVEDLSPCAADKSLSDGVDVGGSHGGRKSALGEHAIRRAASV